MIVVCNTSPLTNLAAIDRFDDLRRQFGEIHIADAVHAELNAGHRRYPGSREVSQALWIRQHTIRNERLAHALHRDLDRGEAETLALAIEMDADLVLMDEQPGRRVAERFALPTLGVVGILLRAKERGDLDAVQPVLAQLRERAGFYLSSAFERRVLEIASEA